MSERDRAADIRLVLLAALAGVAVGAVGTLFHLASDALLAAHDRLAPLPLPAAIAASATLSAVLVLAAVTLVRRFAPEAAGSGVQEIEGALEAVRPLRWRRILPVKFAGGVLAIGSGLVVGREGPTIHIGAALSFGLAAMLRLGDTERRGLAAAGAAAGLTAAFDAPVAAILFVIEETRRQFPYTFRTYAGVIVATIASTVVTREIAGATPDLSLAAHPVPTGVLLAFAGLGILLGAAGVAFNTALVHTLDAFEGLRARFPFLLPLAVGAVAGTLVVVLPEATGGGEALIPELVDAALSAEMLAILLSIRLATTLVSYAVGAPGGIFAPLLTLATVAGLLFHAAAAITIPTLAGMEAAFAIAAMAGMFASSVRAPMVGVVLVAELTGSYDILLPALVTAALSHLVAQALGGEPIYETLLARTLARAGITPRRTGDGVPLELGTDDATERPPRGKDTDDRARG